MGQVFRTGRTSAVWVMVHEAALRNWAKLDIEERAFEVVGQFENKAWTYFKSFIDSAYRTKAQEIANKRTSRLERVNFAEVEQDSSWRVNWGMNSSDKLFSFDDLSIFIF